MGGGTAGVLVLTLIMVRSFDATLSQKAVPRIVRLGNIAERGESRIAFTCPQGKDFSLVWGCPPASDMSKISVTITLSSASETTVRQVVTAASLTESNWLQDHKLAGYIVNYGKGLDGVMKPSEHYTVVVATAEEIPPDSSLWLNYLVTCLPSE